MKYAKKKNKVKFLEYPLDFTRGDVNFLLIVMSELYIAEQTKKMIINIKQKAQKL